MNAIRLRAFLCLFLTGALPLTGLALGLRYLPGNVLPWIAYALSLICVIMAALGLSGFISRPVKDSLLAMAHMLKSGGNYQPKGWVPVELQRLQDGISQLNQAQRGEYQRVRQELDTSQHLITEAEAAAIRSLEVLQALVDHSTDGIVFMHSSGHVVLVGQSLQQIFSLEAEECQPGSDAKAWLNRVAQQLRQGEEAAKQWAQWQEGPSSMMEGEWEIAAATEPRVIQVKSFDVRNDELGSLGRLWIFRETTEQRRLQSRLQEAQKMESIGMLTGGIAHDFNNLLTSIRGNLTLADLDADGAERRAKIEGANQAANRASELVKRLLTFSRKHGTAKSSTELLVAAKGVQSLLESSLDPKVQLNIHPEHMTERVCIDTTQLEQVIMNLCINSRDAMPPKGGIIQVTAEPYLLQADRKPTGSEHTPVKGDYMLLSVRDTGLGIPEELRPRIFEAFFTTKETGKGTGLGLAMVHSIAQEAGGWVEFDSELGEGTEFRVYLPKAAPAAAQVAESPSAPLKAGAAEGSILVVDDEASVRSIAVHMLRYLGYQVLEAADGEEALDIVSQRRGSIDAIMMDVYMPKLSGRDTFKALRQRGHQTPVIVCSGFSVEQDEFASLAEGRRGLVEVIQKPYSMDRLAGAVAKAVALAHE
jgi:two-component system, cell cycle sensor histidine kinase and response regulator CckA